MGSYKDKISYEERWQVIHYIRSLQAKEKKLTYNQLENTLNEVDVPAGENVHIAVLHEETEGDHHSDDDHGHGEASHGEDDDHEGN